MKNVLRIIGLILAGLIVVLFLAGLTNEELSAIWTYVHSLE